MNKLILSAALMLGIIAHAKPGDNKNPTPQELTQQADSVYTPDVVALLQAKYWRDVSNETGRAFWHGKRTEAIADPSNMVTLAVYEDGRVFKDKAKIVTPKESIDKANSMLKKSVDKKGIPKKLVEARMRAAKRKAAGPVEVQHTITAGKN